MIPHKQLSLADVFSDCQYKFQNDKLALTLHGTTEWDNTYKIIT